MRHNNYVTTDKLMDQYAAIIGGELDVEENLLTVYESDQFPMKKPLQVKL